MDRKWKRILMTVIGTVFIAAEGEVGCIGLIVYLSGLDVVQRVGIGALCRTHFPDIESGGEVTDIGLQAERRSEQEVGAVVSYGIRWLEAIVGDGHYSLAVGANHIIALSHSGKRSYKG